VYCGYTPRTVVTPLYYNQERDKNDASLNDLQRYVTSQLGTRDGVLMGIDILG
jgi:hypothetical protein